MSGAAGGADRLADLHARLLAQVAALASSSQWQAMLTVAARFHTYSPTNVLLISAQRPEATRVAGYRAWAQLGRQVRKGEHGIAILAPVLRRKDSGAVELAADPASGLSGAEGSARVLTGFRAVHVFDLAQTDGPALPEVRPGRLDGAAPLALWGALREQVAAAGYSLHYADLGAANGRTDFAGREVVLHPDRSGAQLTKTLAHELAHVELHAPGARPEGLTRERAEVEAESVAFVVTAAHGLDAGNYSVPYVSGWAGGDTELLAQTASRVLSCARAVLHGAGSRPVGSAVSASERTRCRTASRARPPRVADPGRGPAR